MTSPGELRGIYKNSIHIKNNSLNHNSNEPVKTLQLYVEFRIC